MNESETLIAARAALDTARDELARRRGVEALARRAVVDATAAVNVASDAVAAARKLVIDLIDAERRAARKR